MKLRTLRRRKRALTAWAAEFPWIRRPRPRCDPARPRHANGQLVDLFSPSRLRARREREEARRRINAAFRVELLSGASRSLGAWLGRATDDILADTSARLRDGPPITLPSHQRLLDEMLACPFPKKVLFQNTPTMTRAWWDKAAGLQVRKVLESEWREWLGETGELQGSCSATVLTQHALMPHGCSLLPWGYFPDFRLLTERPAV